MAILGPIMIALSLGGLSIYSSDKDVAIIDVLTGSFIFYNYLNALFCLSYALTIRLGVMSGKWWMNVILFLASTIILPTLLIILPTLLIVLPMREMDLGSAVAGGAYQVGKNLFIVAVLVVVVFIAGFFIKDRRKGKVNSATD